MRSDEQGIVGDIETPRDFERMLREEGFSRARAKAITAKGFRAEAFDDLELKHLVNKLHAGQSALEMKRAFKNRIRVFEGMTKSGFLNAFPSPPSVTVVVTPPHEGADFECAISFWTAEGSRIVEKGEVFKPGYTMDTFRYKDPPAVRIGNIADSARGLRFDRRMRYELRYRKSNIDRGPGAKPPGNFIITVH